ncbi:alpha/beta fold hydrolase [Saccharothrix longispora]
MRRLSPPGPARARVLCLPPGGGSAQLYQRWPALLGADLDVVAVELPGRGERSLEAPLTRMTDVVAGVVGALDALDDLPLVVFGHSMGAVVGWELCRELRATGRAVPAGLVVAGAAAPGAPDAARPRGPVTDAELVGLITSSDGLPPGTSLDPLLLGYLLPVLRADLAVVNDFRPDPRPPLPCALRVYLGADDVTVPAEEAEPWAAEVEGPVVVRTFPGGHFFPRDEEAAVLARLRLDVLDCTGLATGTPTAGDRA